MPKIKIIDLPTIQREQEKQQKQEQRRREAEELSRKGMASAERLWQEYQDAELPPGDQILSEDEQELLQQIFSRSGKYTALNRYITSSIFSAQLLCLGQDEKSYTRMSQEITDNILNAICTGHIKGQASIFEHVPPKAINNKAVFLQALRDMLPDTIFWNYSLAQVQDKLQLALLREFYTLYPDVTLWKLYTKRRDFYLEVIARYANAQGDAGSDILDRAKTQWGKLDSWAAKLNSTLCKAQTPIWAILGPVGSGLAVFISASYGYDIGTLLSLASIPVIYLAGKQYPTYSVPIEVKKTDQQAKATEYSRLCDESQALKSVLVWNRENNAKWEIIQTTGHQDLKTPTSQALQGIIQGPQQRSEKTPEPVILSEADAAEVRKALKIKTRKGPTAEDKERLETGIASESKQEPIWNGKGITAWEKIIQNVPEKEIQKSIFQLTGHGIHENAKWFVYWDTKMLDPGIYKDFYQTVAAKNTNGLVEDGVGFKKLDNGTLEIQSQANTMDRVVCYPIENPNDKHSRIFVAREYYKKGIHSTSTERKLADKTTLWKQQTTSKQQGASSSSTQLQLKKK